MSVSNAVFQLKRYIVKELIERNVEREEGKGRKRKKTEKRKKEKESKNEES